MGKIVNYTANILVNQYAGTDIQLYKIGNDVVVMFDNFNYNLSIPETFCYSFILCHIFGIDVAGVSLIYVASMLDHTKIKYECSMVNVQHRTGYSDIDTEHSVCAGIGWYTDYTFINYYRSVN